MADVCTRIYVVDVSTTTDMCAAEQRVVLITGASSGIGRATAIELARRNWRVLLHGRCERKLESLARALEKDCAAGVELFRADFSRPQEVLQLARQVQKKHSFLSALINNAGIWFPRRPPSAEFEPTMMVNYFAPVILSQQLLPELAAAEHGRIVQVASRLHRYPRSLDLEVGRARFYSGLRTYAHSKLALVAFSKHFAGRLPTNVTSNSLHPGEVHSAVTRHSPLLTIGINVVKPFLLSAEQGAEASVWAVTDERLRRVSGAYYHRKSQTPAHPILARPDFCDALWRQTEEILRDYLPD